ncbi:hypothetical protein ACJ2A9_11535 [Anaerobacillus sp. MEB173]|uniref:hypothetical protein n=1 Tax=Anaerobacillus sp. MEB173 TaxID=3383345 RepID=UPI003F93A085
MKFVTKEISELSIGQSCSIERTFTEDDVKLCIRLTGDNNAVYYNDNDHNFKTNDLEGPVTPALLSEGLIMEVMSNKLLGTAGLMLQKDMIYNHPVYVGDTITAIVEIIDIDIERSWVTMMIRCINQDGKVVTTGQVVGLIITEMDN